MPILTRNSAGSRLPYKDERMEKDIYDLLPAGEQNALPMAALKNIIGDGITDREIRARIRQERLNGSLIISTKRNGGGYYRPVSVDEITDFVRTYEQEAASLRAMLKAAKEVLKK